MAKIYRLTDRISVKVGDITIKLSPLTLHQKTEVQQAMMLGRLKGDVAEATRGLVLSLKYSVKDISGVTDSEDSPYQLQFDGEHLSDSCVEDLLNLEITQKLTLICSSLVNGIPKEFTDAAGNKLEGVEIVKPEGRANSPN